MLTRPMLVTGYQQLCVFRQISIVRAGLIEQIIALLMRL
jgi:hypothetical protein